MDSTDFQLFVQARAGDPQAQAGLIERHRPAVLQICRKQLRLHPDAVEDVAQETLARLLGGLGRIADPSRVDHWLAKVAMNQCRTYRDRAERLLPADPNGMVEADPAENIADRMAVRAVLAGVGGPQAALLAAHYLHDRPLALIEEERGLARGSGKVLLHRARRAARNLAESLDIRVVAPAWLWRSNRYVSSRVNEADLSFLTSFAGNVLAAAVVACGLWVGGPTHDTDQPPKTTTHPAGNSAASGGVAWRKTTERAWLATSLRSSASTRPKPAAASSSPWIAFGEVGGPAGSKVSSSRPDEQSRYQLGVTAGTDVEGSEGLASFTVYGKNETRDAAYREACETAEASPALTYCES